MRLPTLIAATALGSALALGACGDDDPGINEAGSPTAEAPSTTAAAAAPAPMQEVPAEGDPSTVTCEAGDGGDEDVDITGFTFDPGELEIIAGESVTFVNQDPADHSVWSDERIDGDPAFESVGSDPAFRLPEVLHTGDSSTCTFPAAGTYAYLCGVHNSMRGTVTVT